MKKFLKPDIWWKEDSIWVGFWLRKPLLSPSHYLTLSLELFQHLISWRFFKQSTFFQRRRKAALSIQLCHWNGKSKQLCNIVFSSSLVNKEDWFVFQIMVGLNSLTLKASYWLSKTTISLMAKPCTHWACVKYKIHCQIHNTTRN